MRELDKAQSAARDGRLEDALDALLVAWRKLPAPEIADAIDAVSEVLTEREPPILSDGGKSARQRWYETLAQGRAASLGRLLEALPGADDVGHRMVELEKRPPDPRFGSAFCRWLRDPPVKGRRRSPFFSDGLELLVRTRDLRALERLEELSCPAERSRTIRVVGYLNLKTVRDAAAKLRALPWAGVDAADRDTLEEIRKALGVAPKQVVDPAALLAQVWAHPDDDAPRAVLSDALLEQADARGEFIALQLARHASGAPPTRRERILEKRWGRLWLGALAPYLAKGDLVFERGFVARCKLARGVHAAARLPEWSTVTHLDLDGFGDSVALLLGPQVGSLRHVVAMREADLEAMSRERGRTVPWETLGLRVGSWDATEALRGAPQVMPEVRRLELSSSFGSLSDVSPDRIASAAAGFSKLVELSVALETRAVTRMLEAGARLGTVTVIERSARYTLRSARRELLVEPRRHEDATAHVVGVTLRDLAGLPIDVVRLRPEGRVVRDARDAEMLLRGSQRMTLTPIRLAADTLGLRFQVELGVPSERTASGASDISDSKPEGGVHPAPSPSRSPTTRG